MTAVEAGTVVIMVVLFGIGVLAKKNKEVGVLASRCFGYMYRRA